MDRKNSAALIELRGVAKSYFNDDLETPVLHDVDLTIRSGEFIAIMGPSGSGKSTLMNILGFLDQPTGGHYNFREKPTENLSEDELAEIRATRVSFVFQSFNLLPRTTVRDNVMLPLLYHPTIREYDRLPRVETAIERVGLTPRIGFLTNQLSGGQQQRVAIARALVTKPDIIFADEPTGNLDSASGAAVLQTLQELHAQGHTIVLVTHERRTAEHAERIIHMVDGRIDSDSKDFTRVLARKDAVLK